jgi:hypothetical protein
MSTTTLDPATDHPDPTVTDHRALLDGRALLRWIPTFLGFPLAGLAARAVAGNIDRPSSAAIGGLAAGAVLGAVQSLGAPSRTAPRTRWMLATALGMAVGLTAGSWISTSTRVPAPWSSWVRSPAQASARPRPR